MAKYSDMGVECVLVTATGGEEGEVLNPFFESQSPGDLLGEIRRGELEKAANIIGYSVVEMMGYRDSGMPEDPANARPDCFWNVPLEESISKLVSLFRRFAPQVVITYPEDQSGYPHPDHLRVHDISVKAFELSGDPEYRPDLGEAFQPKKLYYSLRTARRMELIIERFDELGIDVPFLKKRRDQKDFRGQDHLVTTSIEVGEYFATQRQALLAHCTQIDPSSPYWFGISPEDEARIFPFEEFQLAKVQGIDYQLAPGVIEDDLFCGIS